MGRLKKLKKIRIHREGTHILWASFLLLLLINVALYWGIDCKIPFYVVAVASITVYLLMVNFFRCPIRLFGQDTEKIDRLVGGYARHDLRLIRIRHIAVVVAAGVRSGVPRQGRIAVPAETQRRGGVQTRVLRHVPRIVQHHDRLVGVAHARVAELAGLVTHIGVVVVIWKIS